MAFFVSPHGFGHAARAAAVMEAVGRRLPGVRFEVFTTVPRWFFEDSLTVAYRYREEATDVGLVQRDALDEDLEATVERLRELLPFRRRRLERLAGELRAAGCRLVICDVAPLGLAAARAAGVPSLLVESFTWDWIYRTYAADCPALGEIADELEAVFAGADHHLQTEPLCRRRPGAPRVGPISRPPRLGRAEVRRRLGIPEAAPMVLVTMGGVGWRYPAPEELAAGAGAAEAGTPEGGGAPYLVVPGAVRDDAAESVATGGAAGRLIALPHRSGFHHPDLLHAADGVLAKLGYSTLAEAHRAGVPVGYLRRPRFPESPVLEHWAREHLACRPLDGARFAAGRWREDVAALLRLPRRRPAETDGAAGTAALVEKILG